MYPRGIPRYSQGMSCRGNSPDDNPVSHRRRQLGIVGVLGCVSS